jgi:hypothetical protein
MNRTRLVSALAMAALAAILLPSFLHAQVTFQRTYGGPDNDFGYSVQQTTDGGYIVAGETYSIGSGYSDVYLIKTDAHGDTLWTRTFGGANFDYGWSVHQTADGGYVIAGSTWSFGAGVRDVYLIKTDASGDTLWTKVYGGTDQDRGYSVQQTADGGFIVAGYTGSFGAGCYDAYLIKTDAQGDTLWTRTYGCTNYDYGFSVEQTTDGGYVIAGYTFSLGAVGGDAYLVKTDAAGDTLWTRTLGGGKDDHGYSVQQTADGGYIIAGYTYSFGVGTPDSDNVYLIKTNASGDTLWARTYGGTGSDAGYSVRQTSDGGYIIAGLTYSFGAGQDDVYLVKINASGDTIWTRTYGGADEDWGHSIQQTSDGGYIIAGITASFGAGSYDVYLIKTDSLGNVAVAEPKASPTRAPALSLSCEPNPFRTRTAISLQLTADSPAELAIFDAAGRRVRTFTVDRTPYTVWDGKDDFAHPLPSGAYFARLDAGGQHATARIVLQR